MVEHPDPEKHEHYLLIDWGNLSDGLLLAKQADPEKKNKRVQNALTMDIPGCDVWRRDLPKDMAKFLVNWYNKGNDDSTCTTPLEIAEATVQYEASWSRHSRGNVSRDTHTAKQIECEHLKMVNEMCENYSWATWTEYERVPRLYRECNNPTYTIRKGPHKGQLIWDAIKQRVVTDVDATKFSPPNYKSWFKLVDDATRVLKHDAPEAIVEIGILGLPRTGDAKHEFPHLPDGVPALRSEDTNDVNLKALIQDMSGTKTINKLETEAAAAAAEAKAVAAEPGAQAASTGRVRGVQRVKGRGGRGARAGGSATSLGPVGPVGPAEKAMFYNLLQTQKQEVLQQCGGAYAFQRPIELNKS